MVCNEFICVTLNFMKSQNRHKLNSSRIQLDGCYSNQLDYLTTYFMDWTRTWNGQTGPAPSRKIKNSVGKSKWIDLNEKIIS